jgi:hypothetical protein
LNWTAQCGTPEQGQVVRGGTIDHQTAHDKVHALSIAPLRAIFRRPNYCLEARSAASGHLLLPWPEPVCSASGYISMSLISALFWHVAGTRQLLRPELSARAESLTAGPAHLTDSGRSRWRLCVPVAVLDCCTRPLSRTRFCVNFDLTFTKLRLIHFPVFLSAIGTSGHADKFYENANSSKNETNTN